MLAQSLRDKGSKHWRGHCPGIRGSYHSPVAGTVRYGSTVTAMQEPEKLFTFLSHAPMFLVEVCDISRFRESFSI